MVRNIILIASFFIIMLSGIAIGETEYFEENFKKHLSPSEKTNPELLTV